MTKMFSVLCVALLTLPACSRIDIAYQWADTLITSKVDDYFDISSEQSRALKKSLKQDFQRLREDIVPTWIDEAKKLDQDVANNNLDEKRVAEVFTSVMNDVETVPSHFSQSAGQFIASADLHQLEYFATAFKKKSDEEVAKFQNQKRFARDYRQKYVKYFEMFLGRLSSEQQQAIDRHISRQPYPTALKFKNKEFVFEQFMAHKGRREDLKKFVLAFVKQPQQFHLPEYRQQVLRYQADLEKLVVEISLHMTERQKKALRENLQEKITQLQRIQRQS